MTAETINLIDTRKRDAVRAAIRSAALRTARAAAGLIRIDGEVFATADKAREFGVSAKELREIVRSGARTSEEIRQRVAKK